MRTKRTFPVSLLLLCCALLSIAGLLSGCSIIPGMAASAADPPGPTGLTPATTAPWSLDVNVTIKEFQDAPSHMSEITLAFSTALIEDPQNFVIFDDSNEKVICNGVTTPLGDTPQYTFSVPRNEYTCTYYGNDPHPSTLDIIAPTSAQMFDVPLKNMLSPQLPSVSSSGFSIHYTPEPAGSNCSISATATDRSNDSAVNGSSVAATTGIYNGPDVSGLQGDGDVELTRTCDVSPPSTLFHSMHVTYIATASIEVRWTP
jgi:hypothetical protein